MADWPLIPYYFGSQFVTANSGTTNSRATDKQETAGILPTHSA